MLKNKLRFVILALTDSDAGFKLAAYNGLKQRYQMLCGVGMGDAQMKKVSLLKRIMNKGYSQQVMGLNSMKAFLKFDREREEEARLKYERNQKEKDRILRRIMSTSLRFAGMAFNQSYAWTIAARKAEIVLTNRRMGIMRRIVDSNTRLASAGYNKLLEVSKARKAMLKNKLRFVILALTDSDAGFKLAAYNGLKQRYQMLCGVGMGDAQMKKVSLLKRIMNKGYSQQVMGLNSMKAFLKFDREREEEAR